MAVERRDPLAGRPLKGVPSVPVASRPAPPRVPPRPVARAVASPPLRRLVLWPALLTLAVTLLRLAGELQGWSPSVWSRLPGGGLSPLGIAWLAPLVGVVLGWKLERAGVRSPGSSRAIGLPVAALVSGLLVAALLERVLKPSWTANLVLWGVVATGVAAAAAAAWPALGKALLVYAAAARVPVAIVMAVAIFRNWGTHYDAPPPGFLPMLPLRRWLWTGLLPQATVWVAWTVATGAIGGALGSMAARRRL
ncbi:MAG TPA: hypothetical protein VGB87_04325 [Vicinamibacteria bacterium]